MKKIIIPSLLLTVLFNISAATADFEEYTLYKTKEFSKKYSFSEAFISKIKNCIPTEEVNNIGEIETIYKIKGYNNHNECLVEAIGKYNQINITTSCRFDDTTLQLWYDSQIKLKNIFKSAKTMNDILSSEEYFVATGIFMDEDICQSHRSEFDPFKELRTKLQSCEPYKYTLSDGTTPVVLETEIFGYQNNTCHYELRVIQKPLPTQEQIKLLGVENYEKLKDILSQERTMTTSCLLSDNSRMQYINVLKDTIIPEGNALDFKAMQKQGDANKKMLEFLSSLPECSFSM